MSRAGRVLFLAILGAQLAAPQLIPFFDDFESDQGWQLFEEIVGGNPCYGDGIGSMSQVNDQSFRGEQSLRLWANQTLSPLSNHLIAFKKLSTTAVNGRYIYSLRAFMDPDADDYQTGPEISIQNTALGSTGVYSTSVAAIQHQSTQFASPAGPWAIWVQKDDDSPGWADLFVQPLSRGVWYELTLEADFRKNEYIKFSISGPDVDLTYDLSGIRVGRTDGLFSEENLDVTLETENLWSNCGEPEYVAGSRFYYDDVGLSVSPVPEILGVTPDFVSNPALQLDVEVERVSEDRPIEVVNVLINRALTGAQACYLAYHRPSDTLFLVNDAGDGLLPGVDVSTGGTIANSQCSLLIDSGTIESTSTGFVMHLDLTLSGSERSQIVYVAVRDSFGGNSGWEADGVGWLPVGGQPLSVYPVFPFGVSGQGQRHTFQYTYEYDPTVTGIDNLQVLINRNLDGRAACWVGYSTSLNQFFLVDDDGGTLLPAMDASSNSSRENGLCVLHGEGSSVTQVGRQLTVDVDLTVKRPIHKFLVFTTATGAGGIAPGWVASGIWSSR